MGLENNIPEGWKKTTIGKATIVESGGTPSTKNPSYWSDEISWITPKDLSSFKGVYVEKGERSISIEGLENSSAKLLPKNTILFSSRAPIGYVAIAKNETATNQGFKNLICDEVNSHYKYFYYLIKYKSNFIERLSSGSTFSEASGTLIKSIELNLPTIPEQKAIAKVLTAFDDKIELLQEQNKILETMAQTIFKEWFGKYQIGDELPEGWRVGKITELFEVKDGTHDSPKETKIGKQLITSRHISKERIKFEESYFISDDDFNAINKRSKVDQYDILFSMIGTLGLTYLEQNADVDYAIKNLALFKTSKRKEYSIYTYLWLIGIHGKHYVIKNKSGSTQEFMSLGSLRNIEFLIPSDQTLIDFNSLCEPIFKKIKINSSQIQSLTKTRDTLLPKLMSGQVRMNNIKQTADA